MVRGYAGLFLILFLGLPGIAWGNKLKTERLCEHLTVIGDLDPPLSDVEKRLVCGDVEGNKKHPNQFDAWKTIPFPQAKFHFTQFLQSRGYHHPHFEQVFPPFTLTKKPEIIANIGEKTLVHHIYLEGTGYSIPIDRKRDIIGKPLTPDILGRLEKWVIERLQAIGYGCPEVTSQADPNTGDILVSVTTGPLQYLVEVTEESVPGLRDNTLRRYDAFRLNEPFNGDLLSVTENRVSSIGIVESNHFTTQCGKDGVHVHQSVVSGAPRLLIVQFGVNTEGVLVGKVSWKNTRLGQSGSMFDISGYASSKRQSISSRLNWYFLPYTSRLYLDPLLEQTHRNVHPFEELVFSVQVGVSTTFDYGPVGGSVFIGPMFDYFRTLRGIGAPQSHFLSIENRISLKSHDFEYFISNPQQGYLITLTTDLNGNGIYSSAPAQRLYIRGESLWNLGDWSPSLWVLGLRGGGAAVVTDVSSGPDTPLPANFLQYLGGSADLRGFGLLTLPINQQGGLTSGFLGLELRYSHVLPFNVDPFLFTDVGAIGRSPFSFDSPVYWCPGFGIRWNSPVGPFRTTFAHGYTNAVLNGWQFYFSFGEEF